MNRLLDRLRRRLNCRRWTVTPGAASRDEVAGSTPRIQLLVVPATGLTVIRDCDAGEAEAGAAVFAVGRGNGQAGGSRGFSTRGD